MLEAAGSISVRASDLPEGAFSVAGMPAACRLSDDYWISHHLQSVGVATKLLPTCVFDFGQAQYAEPCGRPFGTIPTIQHIGALSEHHNKASDMEWPSHAKHDSRKTTSSSNSNSSNSSSNAG